MATTAAIDREPPQGEGGDECAPDVVRGVPDGHDDAALVRAEPVHHRLAARRPAHALDPAVQRLQQDDDHERGVDRLHGPAEEHDARREQEAERQEVTRVAAIGHRSHQELGQPVGNREPRHRGAESGLGVLRVLLEDVGDCQREGVADEIEGRVADEDADEDLPPQPPVGRIDQIGRQRIGRRGALEDSNHGARV